MLLRTRSAVIHGGGGADRRCGRPIRSQRAGQTRIRQRGERPSGCGRGARRLQVTLPPIAQRSYDRAEALALLGEVVLEPRGVFAVEAARDQAVRFHVLEARRERIRRNAGQRLLEVLEPPRPVQEEVPQHQDRPALADEVERAGDRAALLSIRPSHGRKNNGLTFYLQVTSVLLVTTHAKGRS